MAKGFRTLFAQLRSQPSLQQGGFPSTDKLIPGMVAVMSIAKYRDKAGENPSILYQLCFIRHDFDWGYFFSAAILSLFTDNLKPMPHQVIDIDQKACWLSISIVGLLQNVSWKCRDPLHYI